MLSENMLRLNRFHHVALIVSDYERSKNFYTRILGLQILQETYRQERDSYKLDLALNEHDRLELFSFPEAPQRLSYPEANGLRHLAFEVDNVEEARAALKQLGVSVQPVRVDTLTGKKFAFFADPDDLPLEIYEK